MLRISLLAASLLALAASSSDSYQFRQRGTVAAPRAPLHDGQPLASSVRIEAHAGTITAPTLPTGDDGTSGTGAAVAGKQAGGAIRFRAGDAPVDFGLEVDTAWSPSATTRHGERIAAPDEHVVDVAVAMRTSSRVGTDGNTRIGFVVNLGGHSVPIVRGDSPLGSPQRDTALLFRAAMVPSYRMGAVTLFGSLGLATETDVPSDVYVPGGEDDPGVVAENAGAAFTLAAGASVDLGSGARATARLSDAFTDGANGHYGPQVDVGLSFDIGR